MLFLENAYFHCHFAFRFSVTATTCSASSETPCNLNSSRVPKVTPPPINPWLATASETNCINWTDLLCCPPILERLRTEMRHGRVRVPHRPKQQGNWWPRRMIEHRVVSAGASRVIMHVIIIYSALSCPARVSQRRRLRAAGETLMI